MIIENKNGKEREFKVLLEINKDKNNYIIYEDIITNKVYCGKKDKNNLVVLKDEEYDYLEKILDKIEG